jgi:hypothetical protein
MIFSKIYVYWYKFFFQNYINIVVSNGGSIATAVWNSCRGLSPVQRTDNYSTPATGTIALPPAVWNGVVEELD